MTRAVGEVKAGNLMQRIAPDEAQPSPLELARWLTPQALIPLIALLLSHDAIAGEAERVSAPGTPAA